ncbi:MAG TPA: hypothetical protein VFL14_16245, partial [Xanthomonadales bacterium]|nr:hypothetical protein [Xanthomonadales bacterium]
MRRHGIAALFAAGCTLFVMPGAAGAAASSDEAWNEIVEGTLPQVGAARQIVPLRYRTFTLDRTQLDVLLAVAPMEGARRAADSDAVLELPLPDGSFGAFRIVESPIMEPALAAKFPQIRTWLGQGIDDPTATARFDLTPKGFHAQVIGRDGTSYVDPYRPGDVEHYIA